MAAAPLQRDAPGTPKAADAEAQAASLGRFGLSMTPNIQGLLQAAIQSPATPADLKSLCHQYEDAHVVPWKLMQQCCTSLRPQPASQESNAAAKHSDESRSQQQQQQQQQQMPPPLPAPAVCAGSRIVLPSPPARPRSEALQSRLAQLQEAQDARQYAAMVADVTADEAAAAAALQDPFFPTTKLQLSFGLHVIVTMGTFFALGFYGGRLLLRDEAWAALCGALGLMAGLLLETTLLILRTNMPEPLEKKYGHLLSKDWDQKQQQQQPQPQQAAGAFSPSQRGRVAATQQRQAGPADKLRRRTASRRA